MSKLNVGIGEAAVSNLREDEIKTFALGSCVAIIILDPITKSGGMAHIALPDSTINKEKSAAQPYYFADSAIPQLFNDLERYGVKKHAGLVIKLVGGAKVISASDNFDIGTRNVTAVKKILWEHGLILKAEDTGKDFSRTVALNMQNGKITITSPNKEDWTV